MADVSECPAKEESNEVDLPNGGSENGGALATDVTQRSFSKADVGKVFQCARSSDVYVCCLVSGSFVNVQCCRNVGKGE